MIVFIIEVVFLAVITTALLHQYLNWRTTPVYVSVSTWIGWFLAFSYVFLIPIDVSMSMLDSCSADCRSPMFEISTEALTILWRTIYWTTFALTWVIYPIMQSYVDAGNFTVFTRLKAAVVENLKIYGIMAGAVVVIALILLISDGARAGSYKNVYGILLAVANSFGLFLLICFAGFGLVEIPKRLWRTSNRDVSLKYWYFHVAAYHESRDKSKHELVSTLQLVRKYSETIRDGDPLRRYVEIIIKTCPPLYREVLRGDGLVETRYDKLVALHTRLKRAERRLHRNEQLFDHSVRRATELEDVMRSKKVSEYRVQWSHRPPRTHTLATQLEALEWLWLVHVEAWFYRLACLVAVLLSASVVWSEVVFNFRSQWTDLSVFSHLVKIPDLTDAEIQLVVLIPVGYIAATAFWSLFQLKLFNYYRLIPHHHTEPSSAVFSASYILRLGPALAYNFLQMIGNTSAAFYLVMGPMQDVAVLGTYYWAYFPIVLLGFCLATAFDLYSKFVRYFCCGRFRRFLFDVEVAADQIEAGRQLVARERTMHERRSKAAAALSHRDALLHGPSQNALLAASGSLSGPAPPEPPPLPELGASFGFEPMTLADAVESSSETQPRESSSFFRKVFGRSIQPFFQSSSDKDDGSRQRLLDDDVEQGRPR